MCELCDPIGNGGESTILSLNCSSGVRIVDI
jgi:hypothetical protein